jgi:hypothetical protein
MADLYVLTDGVELLFSEDVELTPIGKIETKEFGQLTPLASQDEYILFTKNSWMPDIGDQFCVRDEASEVWLDAIQVATNATPDRMRHYIHMVAATEPKRTN